jgi:hypothetical protein
VPCQNGYQSRIVWLYTGSYRKCKTFTLTNVLEALKYFLPWLCVNILIRNVSFIEQFIILGTGVIFSLLIPFAAIGEILGSSVIIYMMVAGLYLTWKFISSSNTISMTWISNNDLFYIFAGTIFCIACRLLGFDDIVSHTESMKISVLVAFFLILLYIDVRRIRSVLPLPLFGRALIDAVLFSVLAIPVAAIAISFVFLLIVSVLGKVGADPEHSELMNLLVFYGTLYGPFYIIYWNAKKNLLALPLLPTGRR